MRLKQQKRGLQFLNHNERRALRKLTKNDEGELVEIDLLQLVHATDQTDKPINGEKGGPPELKEIVLYALRCPIPDDQKESLQDKDLRAGLIKRIKPSNNISMTKREMELCSARVGKVFLQVDLYSRVKEILSEPTPQPVPAAPAAPVEAPVAPPVEGA